MLRFERPTHRLLAAVILAIVCTAGFVGISVFNQYRFGLAILPSVHATWIDARIPFEPEWIWIYLLYYPFCFLPLVLADVRNEVDTFKRTLAGFALQFTVSFAFFLFLPLRMVHAAPPLDLQGRILGEIYRFDLGFNSFPSLHLANVVFVAILFFRFQPRYRAALVAAVALLIAASTMLVKQHFLSDVVVGALVGWGSYAMAFYGKTQKVTPCSEETLRTVPA